MHSHRTSGTSRTPARTSRRSACAAAAALLLVALLPGTAGAHGGDHDRGHGTERPTSYLLDPVGAAADDVFPEGIAVARDDFYVGSTTDGTIYRGDLDEPVATPFLPGGADGRTAAIGMKVDRGTLFVAGGATGRLFAYDLRSRTLVGSWQVEQTGAPTFLNDVAVSPRGDVYVTDSLRPYLYRVDARERRTTQTETLPVHVAFEGTALTYTTGFNVNGIALTRDGRYAVLAQSNAAALFRVRLDDGDVRRIDLGGEAVAGDGLVLDGRRLHVVERQGDLGQVVTIELDRRVTSGTVVSRTTDPSFDDPTTAALVRGSLLVVNSQFGERNAGEAPDPFTVSRIPVP
ncbi:SMP-30/gluconolactonase/LRE family protein [Cellulomonas cellasea]|uniref:Superoxide dismutase n=2 Tax=Cellulomonas cellasea TaxID=43670 RepID=A0A0A0B8F0_9CELL|nr:hypothetical protein [Cellulomonas cellasea]KGM02458.1 superoxide dismutase [Cellulomonas cellasea DSM 20118]GEA86358.1 hypothetical protein CCE01nite_03070 [Cellulomonas cellasea]